MCKQMPATASADSTTAERARLCTESATLCAQVAQLLQRVVDLGVGLAKDSHSSSKPLSAGPPFKKPLLRSLRQRTGKKPGGQNWHTGATPELIEKLDQAGVVALTGAYTCWRYREKIATEVLRELRQVAEFLVCCEVTEYRIVAGVCACGQAQGSAFSAGVGADVHCGSGVFGVAVYMTQYQSLPYQLTADPLDKWAGIAISPASIHTSVTLVALVPAIGQALVGVAGALLWLQVLITSTLIAYFAHPKRVRAPLDAFGLLRPFAGTLVYDYWLACDHYIGRHRFCNAHHLRELIGVADAFLGQDWALRMIGFLCEAKQAAGRACAQWLAVMPAPELD